MIYRVTIGDRTRRVDVSPHPDGGWWVVLDSGTPRHVTGRALATSEWVLHVDGVRHRVDGCVGEDGRSEQVELVIGGTPLRAHVVDAGRASLVLGTGEGEGEIRTEMPGAIVRLLVKEGEDVRRGQPLVVVEAMKMENELRAPIDGVVRTVAVAEGDRVEANTILLVLEPTEST